MLWPAVRRGDMGRLRTQVKSGPASRLTYVPAVSGLLFPFTVTDPFSAQAGTRRRREKGRPLLSETVKESLPSKG